MSSILDIDLDYFRFFDRPLDWLDALLGWAERPIGAVFEQHHKALNFWTRAVNRGVIDTPHFILHADEHHDLLSDQPPIQFGNFMFFAMRRWPKCRVHWLVDRRIDSPQQWLSEEAWESLARRFTCGPHRPRMWPKPELVTVATSPGFLDEGLRRRLMKRSQRPAYLRAKYTEAMSGRRPIIIRV